MTTFEPREATEGDITDVVLGSARWVLLESWGARVLQLATFVVLGRLLMPTDFGIVALAASVTAIVSVLVDAGFSAYLISQKNLRESSLNTAFYAALALGLTLMLGLQAAAPLMADALDEPRLTAIIRALAVALPLGAIESVAVARLHRAFSFKVVALRRLGAATLGALIGVVLAVLGAGPWALVGQALMYPLVGVVVLYTAAPWRPTGRPEGAELRRMLRFGGSILGSNVLGLSNQHVDKLLIGALLGAEELGYYVIGYRMVTVVLEFSTVAISNLALPTLARLQGDPQLMCRAFLKATRVSASLGHPVFLLLAALTPALIPVVFGDRWLPSVDIMQVLALLGAVQVVTYLDRALLVAAQRPDLEFKINVAAACGDVVAVLIGLQFGTLGVATALVLRAVAFFPLRALVKRHAAGLPVREYVTQFSTSLIPASLSAGLVVLCRPSLNGAHPAVELVTGSLVGLLAYLLLLRLMAPASFAELLDMSGRLLGFRRQKAVTDDD